MQPLSKNINNVAKTSTITFCVIKNNTSIQSMAKNVGTSIKNFKGVVSKITKKINCVANMLKLDGKKIHAEIYKGFKKEQEVHQDPLARESNWV